MMYYDFTVGNTQYKLRIDIRNIVALEKKIGGNPLSIFGKGETIPTIDTMIMVLHAALQHYHHGITIDGAMAIFEEWLEDGHNTVDFISIILEIYKVSGIVGKEDEKNA